MFYFCVESIASVFNFEQHVKEQARITSKSKTIIDLTFWNKLKSKVISGVVIVSVPDHIMNFAVLSKHSTKSEHTIIKTKSFKNLNPDNLLRDLNNVPWHTVETMDNVEDIFNTHAPLKTFRAGKNNFFIFNEEVASLRVTRDEYHAEAIKTFYAKPWLAEAQSSPIWTHFSCK